MQASFSLLTAAEIRFGRGQALSAVEWIAQRAQRVLLVCGASQKRSAFLFDALTKAQRKVSLFSVAHEPDINDIQAGVMLARTQKVELVLGIGGGAVMDTAKAIAALAPNSDPIEDYLEVIGNGRTLDVHPLPLVAIPTTAGTGAEVTKNAVINVPEYKRKVSLRDNRMLPDLAIVDPSLMDGTPLNITLASGLDALTQVIEPYLCQRANPFTDALCRDAIPRGIKALQVLMEQENQQSRDDMAWVSLCGGLALANSGLGVIHGLAGPLGGLSHAAHGALCGCLLPFGLELNQRYVVDPAQCIRFDEVRSWLAQAMDVAPDEAFHALKMWNRRYGLASLRVLGVSRQDLDTAAKMASTSSSMKANPVPLSYESLLAMLQEAWD